MATPVNEKFNESQLNTNKKMFDKKNNSTLNAEGSTEQSNVVYQSRMVLGRKIIYGLGGIPMQITTVTSSFYLSLFMLETVGLDPLYLSAVLFSGRIWDAITDPIFGIIVAKTKTRFGALKPYILLSCPLVMTSYFLLFYKIDIESQTMLLIYFCFIAMAFTTSTTIYGIPYSALCIVLTRWPKDRDQMNTIRIVFEVIGMMFGITVFGAVLKIGKSGIPPNASIEMIQDYEKYGYIRATSVCNVLVFICITVVVFGSQERNIFAETFKLEWHIIAKIMKLKSFVILMLGSVCTTTGFLIIQTNMALYIKYVLDLEEHTGTGITTIMIFTLVYLLISQKLSNKFGKKTVFLTGIMTVVPLALCLMLVPRRLELWIFYTIMVLVGYPSMIGMLMPIIMLPDCVDDFVIRYNIRRETIFYSLFIFFQKCSLGVVVAMTGVLISASGYNRKNRVQPETVSTFLRYYVGICSVVFFILAILIMSFYPITQSRRKEISKQILEGVYESNATSAPK